MSYGAFFARSKINGRCSIKSRYGELYNGFKILHAWCTDNSYAVLFAYALPRTPKVEMYGSRPDSESRCGEDRVLGFVAGCLLGSGVCLQVAEKVVFQRPEQRRNVAKKDSLPKYPAPHRSEQCIEQISLQYPAASEHGSAVDFLHIACTIFHIDHSSPIFNLSFSFSSSFISRFCILDTFIVGSSSS
jgi:hypothetical protein